MGKNIAFFAYPIPHVFVLSKVRMFPKYFRHFPALGRGEK
jgi:hypothetical protein